MIDQNAAIDIARQRATKNGWAFAEPLEIVARRRWLSGTIFRFEIRTNAGKRGTKARFTIDATTGEILHEGYISR
jgi:hypothetical protein